MKLKVILDNYAYIDKYYKAEPGLCFYIEDENEKILFDMGYSNVFIENAKKMNVNLEDVNKLVFSHGHNDHTRGLKYFIENFDISKKEIVAHKEAFIKKVCDSENISAPFTKEELEHKTHLNLTNVPTAISKNITFLGEIPRKFPFENKNSIGYKYINNLKYPDYVLDDSALIYKSKKGLFIITGCSHSGICNIISYAKEILNEDRIYGIIGGFHLFKLDNQLEETIKYFKENNIQNLYPCHCVSFKVKARINEGIKVHEVGVSMEINV